MALKEKKEHVGFTLKNHCCANCINFEETETSKKYICRILMDYDNKVIPESVCDKFQFNTL